MTSTQRIVHKIVVGNADEELGTPTSEHYAAVLRADLLDVANDTGLDLADEDVAELEGVVGAVVCDGSVVYLRDADELDEVWETTAARF